MPDETSRDPQQPNIVTRGAYFLFVTLCVETLFSVPYRTVHLATHSRVEAWVAGLAGLAVCMAISINRHLLLDVLASIAKRRPAFMLSPASSLVAGLLLRLGWICMYHQPFTSDGDGYFHEAANLAQRHTYGGPYWPPGFPLFLSPFFAAFGSKQWVAWMCSLLLFAATWFLAQKLAAQMSATKAAGTIAGWLLAVWPGYIAVSNINSKELLLGTVIAAIMLLAFGTFDGTQSKQWLRVGGVGILTGLAALTQPGFTLFPAVLFASDWLRGRRLVPALARTAVTVIFMLAVVLPWTAHNYRTYHRYILISTNGGSVFYTANNAHANASYSEEAQRALPADTIEADRVGYILGKQWIREHPLDFAILSVRKQVVFLGDDGIGVYETLRRTGSGSRAVYNLLKACCSAYWYFLWAVLLCCRKTLFRSRRWAGWFGVAFLPVVYQWAIDSVFESGSRHHMAYNACLAVIVSLALVRVSEPLWRTEDPDTYRMLTLM